MPPSRIMDTLSPKLVWLTRRQVAAEGRREVDALVRLVLEQAEEVFDDAVGLGRMVAGADDAEGHAYGLLGRIVVWTLAVVSLLTLVSLLATFGIVGGSPLAVVASVGTPLSLLLVSILGILLWLGGANRWAAGLLIVLFPVGIVFGMLQAVPALTPLVGLIPLLAFIALGVDLRQRAEPQPAAV